MRSLYEIEMVARTREQDRERELSERARAAELLRRRSRESVVGRIVQRIATYRRHSHPTRTPRAA